MKLTLLNYIVHKEYFSGNRYSYLVSVRFHALPLIGSVGFHESLLDKLLGGKSQFIPSLHVFISSRSSVTWELLFNQPIPMN